MENAKTAIEFGWSAPSIGEQFPQMDMNEAYHFQQDAATLSRLKIRGVITASEHNAAIHRLAKAIWKTAAKKETA
jgi:hypothetical protein